MRALMLVLLFGFLSAAEPVKPILVVAYAPFAGRGVNGSGTLAAALTKQSIAGHPVVHAILPVRWGEPEKRLPALIAQHDPVIIVGLGEGHPGRIAVEMQGVNKAAGPDENKQPPTSELLAADGPASRPSRWRFDSAWFAGGRVPVVASKNAGTYLCNSMLYVGLGLDERFIGFVHLPPQGTVPDLNYTTVLTPPVVTLLKHNVPTVKDSP